MIIHRGTELIANWPTVYTESLPKSSRDASALSGREETVSIVLIVVFFAASCGSERLYQAIQFIFAMCGPLRMDPKDAVFTDECYNGGFMVGR